MFFGAGFIEALDFPF